MALMLEGEKQAIRDLVAGKPGEEEEIEDWIADDEEMAAVQPLVEKQLDLMKWGLIALCFVVAVQSFTMAWLLHGRS